MRRMKTFPQGHPGNNVKVYNCTWDSKRRPGKRLGTVMMEDLAKVEAIYDRKEAEGLNPEIQVSWCAGFAM